MSGQDERAARVDDVLARIDEACAQSVSVGYLGAKMHGQANEYLARMLQRCEDCTSPDCPIKGCRRRARAANPHYDRNPRPAAS